ncbi:MAG: hypothetical protein DRO94_03430 [Candidatus Altiarchaeales archaeon]|nr:MAG: hypothetical protein DRO94_03430 [Candidatus Altiarchaeales archaeon]
MNEVLMKYYLKFPEECENKIKDAISRIKEEHREEVEGLWDEIRRERLGSTPFIRHWDDVHKIAIKRGETISFFPYSKERQEEEFGKDHPEIRDFGVEFLKQYASERDVWLNIGGSFSVPFWKLKQKIHKGRAWNIDISKIAVEEANRKGIDSVVGDVQELRKYLPRGIKPGEVSVIVSAFVFEYLENPEKAFREIYETLREGGIAVLRFHHPKNYVMKRMAERIRIIREELERHPPSEEEKQKVLDTLFVWETCLKNVSPPEKWVSMLEKVGFRVLQKKEIEISRIKNGIEQPPEKVFTGIVIQKPPEKARPSEIKEEKEKRPTFLSPSMEELTKPRRLTSEERESYSKSEIFQRVEKIIKENTPYREILLSDETPYIETDLSGRLYIPYTILENLEWLSRLLSEEEFKKALIEVANHELAHRTNITYKKIEEAIKKTDKETLRRISKRMGVAEDELLKVIQEYQANVQALIRYETREEFRNSVAAVSEFLLLAYHGKEGLKKGVKKEYLDFAYRAIKDEELEKILEICKGMHADLIDRSKEMEREVSEKTMIYCGVPLGWVRGKGKSLKKLYGRVTKIKKRGILSLLRVVRKLRHRYPRRLCYLWAHVVTEDIRSRLMRLAEEFDTFYLECVDTTRKSRIESKKFFDKLNVLLEKYARGEDDKKLASEVSFELFSMNPAIRNIIGHIMYYARKNKVRKVVIPERAHIPEFKIRKRHKIFSDAYSLLFEDKMIKAIKTLRRDAYLDYKSLYNRENVVQEKIEKLVKERPNDRILIMFGLQHLPYMGRYTNLDFKLTTDLKDVYNKTYIYTPLDLIERNFYLRDDNSPERFKELLRKGKFDQELLQQVGEDSVATYLKSELSSEKIRLILLESSKCAWKISPEMIREAFREHRRISEIFDRKLLGEILVQMVMKREARFEGEKLGDGLSSERLQKRLSEKYPLISKVMGRELSNIISDAIAELRKKPKVVKRKITKEIPLQSEEEFSIRRNILDNVLKAREENRALSEDELMDKIPREYRAIFEKFISELLRKSEPDIRREKNLLDRAFEEAKGKVIRYKDEGEYREVLYSRAILEYFCLKYLGQDSESAREEIKRSIISSLPRREQRNKLMMLSMKTEGTAALLIHRLESEGISAKSTLRYFARGFGVREDSILERLEELKILIESRTLGRGAPKSVIFSTRVRKLARGKLSGIVSPIRERKDILNKIREMGVEIEMVSYRELMGMMDKVEEVSEIREEGKVVGVTATDENGKIYVSETAPLYLALNAISTHEADHMMRIVSGLVKPEEKSELEKSAIISDGFRILALREIARRVEGFENVRDVVLAIAEQELNTLNRRLNTDFTLNEFRIDDLEIPRGMNIGFLRSAHDEILSLIDSKLGAVSSEDVESKVSRLLEEISLKDLEIRTRWTNDILRKKQAMAEKEEGRKKILMDLSNLDLSEDAKNLLKKLIECYMDKEIDSSERVKIGRELGLSGGEVLHILNELEIEGFVERRIEMGIKHKLRVEKIHKLSKELPKSTVYYDGGVEDLKRIITGEEHDPYLNNLKKIEGEIKRKKHKD